LSLFSRQLTGHSDPTWLMAPTPDRSFHSYDGLLKAA
jgi:hypothetical protein